mgnify:CR=1 FL=1
MIQIVEVLNGERDSLQVKVDFPAVRQLEFPEVAVLNVLKKARDRLVRMKESPGQSTHCEKQRVPGATNQASVAPLRR